MTRKTKYLLVLAAVCCIVLLGGTRFAPLFQRQTIPILMYHDLCPDTETPGRYAVTASRFRQDMEWLNARGYTPMVAADLIEAQRTNRLPPNPVMITFDDGYRSNLTIAAPILEDTGMKATVAIIGTLIREGRHGYMTVADARAAQETGVLDIQSHTYNLHGEGLEGAWPHYGCGVYRRNGETKEAYQARFAADLAENMALITEIGGKQTLFAYPFGHCDPWSMEVLRDAGIEVTLFTGNRLHKVNDSLCGMTRLEVTMEKRVEDWLQ